MYVYIQYTGKVRKERREDNDCDAEADKRTAAAKAYPSSSSYDIDNSPVEREAEAVFPMHIPRVYPPLPPPRSPSLFSVPLCKRPRRARGERTAIFIEARIHRAGGGEGVWIT